MTDIPLLPTLEELWKASLNWQPNQHQQQHFQQLYEAIILGNRQFNLTRITEPEAFWEKHLWDSLAGIQWVGLNTQPTNRQKLNVIDIGTGAGFPGIPSAIAQPTWSVTLLDSTRKKTAFLIELVNQLNLKKVRVVTGRAEVINQKSAHAKRYDLALIRAVGSASVCAQYALPLLKSSGLAVLYRGHWQDQETSTLQSTIAPLKGTIEAIYSLQTPLTQSTRHCLYLRKN